MSYFGGGYPINISESQAAQYARDAKALDAAKTAKDKKAASKDPRKLDPNSATSDCMILFSDTNYEGKYAKRCSTEVQGGACIGDNYGRCSIMPCADDGSEGCWGFGDRLSSYKVDTGMILKLYWDANFKASHLESKGGEYPKMPDDWNDGISSWELKKDCSHKKWIWDKDCETKNSNTAKADQQVNRRKEVCSVADLTKDTKCNAWCFKNPDSCPDSIKKICSMPQHIKGNACRNWGASNVTTFDSMVTNYCKANIKENEFCSCFESNARYPLTEDEQKLLYGGVQKNGTNNRAICWSKNCGNVGYATKSMKAVTAACPACYQVSSNNTTLIDNINKSTINAGMVQTCNVQNKALPNSDETQVSKDNTNTTTTNPDLSTGSANDLSSTTNPDGTTTNTTNPDGTTTNTTNPDGTTTNSNSTTNTTNPDGTTKNSKTSSSTTYTTVIGTFDIYELIAIGSVVFIVVIILLYVALKPNTPPPHYLTPGMQPQYSIPGMQPQYSIPGMQPQYPQYPTRST